MRGFYLGWPISQATPAKSLDTARSIQPHFPLPWTHYVRLLAVKNAHARAFYETEALRGGWTSRQLDRQIQSLSHQLDRAKGIVARSSGEGVEEAPKRGRRDSVCCTSAAGDGKAVARASRPREDFQFF